MTDVPLQNQHRQFEDLPAGELPAYFFSGSLWPFAANASPKAFRGPPPAGFW
jgi:hypothetical protein